MIFGQEQYVDQFYEELFVHVAPLAKDYFNVLDHHLNHLHCHVAAFVSICIAVDGSVEVGVDVVDVGTQAEFPWSITRIICQRAIQLQV